MNNNDMIRISLDLDKPTFEKFSIQCIKSGKRKTAILRELVLEFLKR